MPLVVVWLVLTVAFPVSRCQVGGAESNESTIGVAAATGWTAGTIESERAQPSRDTRRRRMPGMVGSDARRSEGEKGTAGAAIG